MAEKLRAYQGFLGQLHSWRDQIREWRESNSTPNLLEMDILSRNQRRQQQQIPSDSGLEAGKDYSHVYRKKTRMELIRISAAVMGIEFSYAAETAFVSPTLLKIGVQHEHMTLVWAVSPLIGFFVTPVLGSLSDRCRLQMGRRRPFIIVLAIGVLLGLLLVPNGEDIGHWLGDFYPSRDLPKSNVTDMSNATDSSSAPVISDSQYSHPWGVFFTILGTALLDFDADACQSPSRAYLLDITIPEDHAGGLSTFTIMAGLGGFLGYALGGINWDATALGAMLGGHVRAVFTLITFIFTICVGFTITSFDEVPLEVIERDLRAVAQGETARIRTEQEHSYGTVTPRPSVVPTEEGKDGDELESRGNPFNGGIVGDEGSYINHGFDEAIPPDIKPAPLVENENIEPAASLGQYLLSILYMPNSMRILCLTNLFCWMAHVCYSLYFTDFVGEAVFKGDPKAGDGSEAKELYERGVRFGCWGMSMYSLSCACYSYVIERLIVRFRARVVYVGGLLVYSTGMMLMALTQHPVGVIIFSWTAGVMYSTLFTMPYLLIAHYHASDTFEVTAQGSGKVGTHVRGLGTDVAILSSMVFLAQFILSMFMGTVVSAVGSTVAVIGSAAFLAFCGSISAYHIMYLDL